MNTFGDRCKVSFVRGERQYLYDTQGKKYTDFLGGIAVNIFGYGDEGLKKTINTIVERGILHTSNYFYNEPQTYAAELLCRATNMSKVFFCNSGAEANEGAIKLARKYFYNQGKPNTKIIAMKNSFHGRTLATLAATGQEKFHTPYLPLMEQFVYVDYNDISQVEAQIEGACAVIFEPIQGEGGVIAADRKYLSELRALAKKHGVVLIADEVQTGMGRTGEFLASMYSGIIPDIVTLAKGLGGGVAVGAVLANEKVGSAFSPGDHGSTFGGNYLACSAAAYVTERILTTDILENVRTLEKYFLHKLTNLISGRAEIPRGRGFMLALPLDETADAHEVAGRLLKSGFVVGTAGGNCLRFLPPYIIEKKDIDALCEAIDDVLEQR